MQAVGNQVIVALTLMFTPFVIILLYYWSSIKDFYLRQIAQPQPIIQQPAQRQQIRRQRNDGSCAVCLTQPKKFQVSSTCSHSFCGECLFQIYNRFVGTKVKCPLCRNEMSVMFRCFNQNQQPRHQARQIISKIRQYNMLFDDNRPFLRRVLEFPYILRRLINYVFSLRFLVFFFRNIYFIRLFFIILLYVLMPFDILPQSIMGVIGFIDDLVVSVIIISYIVTIVAVQFYRNQH